MALTKITNQSLVGITTMNNLATAPNIATDLSPVRQDVLTLALKQATQENSTKFNLPNSAITKFEAGADYDSAGSTTVSRDASEFISSIASTTGGARFANTLNGSAVRSAAQSKFGSYSLYCAADADYWTSGTLNGVTGMPTTGDFTIDFWQKQESRVYADREFSFGPTSGGTDPTIAAGFNATAQMNVLADGANNDMVSGTNNTDWHHYVYQRSGTTIYHWFDGVYKSNFSNSYSVVNLTADHATGYLMISGRHGGATERTHGYYDEFRLSNVARYTNSVNFTPMTTAYSVANGGADANTVILLHFDDTACADTSGYSSALSATGTALGTTNVPSSAVTDVSGVMLLKNSVGTNTLGTDVKVYFTANNSNWTEVTSYADAGTFSTGIKMIKLGKKTCTSGSDVRWKIVFANQSGSKTAQIYGIGINY